MLLKTPFLKIILVQIQQTMWLFWAQPENLSQFGHQNVASQHWKQWTHSSRVIILIWLLCTVRPLPLLSKTQSTSLWKTLPLLISLRVLPSVSCHHRIRRGFYLGLCYAPIPATEKSHSFAFFLWWLLIFVSLVLVFSPSYALTWCGFIYLLTYWFILV